MPRRGFTLVELIATIAIAATLSVMAITFIGNYVVWAQKTSNERTLTILNEALNRYRALGGMQLGNSLGAANTPNKAAAVITALKNGFTLGGQRTTFLRSSETIDPTLLSVSGLGKSLSFCGYGASGSSSFAGSYRGPVLYSFWNGLVPLTDFQYSSAPVSTQYFNSFAFQAEYVMSGLENYHASLRAYLTPPATDDYIFYYHADDSGDLYLSTSSSPSNRALIASSDWQTPITTAPIHLIGGQSYYIESRHNQGSGHDYAVTGWHNVANTFSESVISSAHLSPYEP